MRQGPVMIRQCGAQVACLQLTSPPGLPQTNTTLLTTPKITGKRQASRKSTTYIQKKLHFRPSKIPANSSYFHQAIKHWKSGSCCFLFQNTITDSSSMRTSLEFVRDSIVSYLGLQETKMNTDHSSCIPLVKRTFSRNILGCNVHASSNITFLSSTLHQHRGLLSAVTRSFSSSKTQCFSDPTSCIKSSVLSLNNLTISVFNIYIPHRRLGPETNFTQAVNAIRLLKLSPPNILPSVYVHNTLPKPVNSAKEKNHPIIVGGGFNEEYIPMQLHQADKVTMTTMMSRLGLVLATCSPGKVTPPIYSKGKKPRSHMDLFYTKSSHIWLWLSSI